MASLVETVLQALWLMLPAYLANMAPVLVGGGTPIDGGRNWKDGRRILGDGKTWRGLLLPPFLVAAAIVGLHYAAQTEALRNLGWSSFGPTAVVAGVLGFAIALGALVGDAVESFFKRRLNKKRGEAWFPFDQLDFVVGGLLFGLLAATILQVVGATAGNVFLEIYQVPHLIVIFILTPLLHFLVNVIGYF
ncbi:MAG TPA: CDP-2,3-bis-(O-geranylgeranyl)-sn-glycerol synthase, partial [Candidatus Thermoplasmatota archaeon]|nr:CDP-2,3-bis-(O-geranylgeranyl)-sn-glycerol synthase [Candidatus Thermoplasmatota archaeon]